MPVCRPLSHPTPSSHRRNAGLWINAPPGLQACNATPDYTAPLPDIPSDQAWNATFKLTAPQVPAGDTSATALVHAFADYLCEDTFAPIPPEGRQSNQQLLVCNPVQWPHSYGRSGTDARAVGMPVGSRASAACRARAV